MGGRESERHPRARPREAGRGLAEGSREEVVEAGLPLGVEEGREGRDPLRGHVERGQRAAR